MSDVALVTGAATGIGAATVRQLSENGAKVAVCDINETVGSALADEVGGTFIPCNVADFDSVASAVAACADLLGEPTLVHLNAGIMTVPTDDPFLAIEDVSVEQFNRIVGVNLGGVFNGLKALLPRMKMADGGAITITASTAAFGELPIDPLYSATKHSLVGFARSIATANADTNVRVNVICPGVVDTAIVPEAFRSFPMLTPDDLAKEVVDLLFNGANGEVRVKTSGQDGFVVPAINVNSGDGASLG